MSTRPTLHWRHYQATLSKAELMIELADLAEFMRFAEDHRVQTIFCFGSNGAVQRFGMSHKGGLIVAEAQGFNQLTDYRTATERGFADAASYYDACDRGFTSFEAYQLSKGSEMNDPETYKALVEAHYEDGFEEYTRLLKEGRLQAIPENISNAYDLFRFGTDADFTNWFELQAALEKGFLHAGDYRSALELGYASAEEYRLGNDGGFHTGTEWRAAHGHGCTSRKEYVGMLNLNMMDAPRLKHDGRVLLQLFSRLPEKKSVTVDKIQQLLEKELTLYQDPDTLLFRKWFTFQLRDRKQLLTFLRKNDDIKRYGSYHHDKGVFETRAVEERHVVLDGSNVAHNSSVNYRDTPKVANLKRMMEALTKRGFNDIHIIVDASLKHKIDDRAALEQFAASVSYHESQAGTSADLDIINYVKKHNCLMVSNDHYREWKVFDPWIDDG